MHSFVLLYFVSLLSMLVTSMSFDLIIVSPMEDSIVANIIFTSCLVMICYREMWADLVLLNLQDFDVILGLDWLSSYHASVDCFWKMATFHIPS